MTMTQPPRTSVTPSQLGALELKIPPLIVVTFMALAMWSTARLFPTLTASFTGRRWFASAVFAIAIAVLVAGVRAFAKANTTVNPHQPDTSSSVVTAGVYRFTRNPMYLGMLLALLSWAIVLSNAAAVVFLPLFVLFINRFQIRPEERALTAKFGDQYSAYLRTVRRWL
jgi:protein-S-isoprenylcysteine O-methyltransferase Ste14